MVGLYLIVMMPLVVSNGWEIFAIKGVLRIYIQYQIMFLSICMLNKTTGRLKMSKTRGFSEVFCFLLLDQVNIFVDKWISKFTCPADKWTYRGYFCHWQIYISEATM